MKTFYAETNIKAPPEAIWNLLTDATGYPTWDPGTIRIKGTIAQGERIAAYSKLSPNRAFPVKVAELVPNRRMVWTGGMPLGLFKGVRTFTLTPKEDGSTDFSIREDFNGPLLPLMIRILPDMTTTFQEFAAGLKARAESVS